VSHECSAQVTAQPVPLPCDRSYRLRLLWTGLTACGSSGHPPSSWISIPLREPIGHPKFQVASLHACHGFEPRRIRHELTFYVRDSADFQYVHTVVIRILYLFTGLNCLEGLRLPCGLHASLCTLRSNRSAVLPFVFRRLPVPINKGDPPNSNDLPVFERNTR
jgi:hypothetical protein